MSKIKQVLQLHKSGFSNRRIASELNLYKGRVNAYIQKVKENRFEIDSLLALEDPYWKRSFSRYASLYRRALRSTEDKLSYFEKELKRLSCTVIHLQNIFRNILRDTVFTVLLSPESITTARHPSAVLEHTAGM